MPAVVNPKMGRRPVRPGMPDYRVEDAADNALVMRSRVRMGRYTTLADSAERLRKTNGVTINGGSGVREFYLSRSQRLLGLASLPAANLADIEKLKLRVGAHALRMLKNAGLTGFNERSPGNFAWLEHDADLSKRPKGLRGPKHIDADASEFFGICFLRPSCYPFTFCHPDKHPHDAREVWLSVCSDLVIYQKQFDDLVDNHTARFFAPLLLPDATLEASRCRCGPQDCEAGTLFLCRGDIIHDSPFVPPGVNRDVLFFTMTGTGLQVPYDPQVQHTADSVLYDLALSYSTPPESKSPSADVKHAYEANLIVAEKLVRALLRNVKANADHEPWKRYDGQLSKILEKAAVVQEPSEAFEQLVARIRKELNKRPK